MESTWANDQTCRRLAEIARSWLGTPFYHRAAVRGRGVDCVMLMGEIFLEAGLVNEYVFPPYFLDYSRHQSLSILRQFLDAHPRFRLLPAGTPARMGDLVCFKIGKTEHHAGLMLGESAFIHCVQPQGVLESGLHDPSYAKRFSCLYRPLEAERPPL